MKRPKKGIRSTTKKPLQAVIASLHQPAGNAVPRSPIAQVNPPIIPLFNEAPPYHGPLYNAKME